MSSFRKAGVYVDNLFAGILSETDEGYVFEYDSTYLSFPGVRAVSLTMPLMKDKYVSKTLFPFFDGLIPEGWLLDVAVRNWKLDPGDRFGLLLAVCRDCIGDVSVKGWSEE